MLFGTMLMIYLFAATVGRKKLPSYQWPPFSVYCDEFQLFSTETFSRFLQEARKYQVAVHIDHQYRSQISGVIKDAVKAAANCICFQLASDDARELVSEFASRR